jgi:hypothetical protein
MTETTAVSHAGVPSTQLGGKQSSPCRRHVHATHHVHACASKCKQAPRSPPMRVCIANSRHVLLIGACKARGLMQAQHALQCCQAVPQQT